MFEFGGVTALKDKAMNEWNCTYSRQVLEIRVRVLKLLMNLATKLLCKTRVCFAGI